MNIKTLTLAAVLAVASTSAFAQSALDRYNAKYVNSPAVKEALLKSTCANANGANLVLCDRWTREGVPNGDVRVGLIATGAVVGGAAGLVTSAVPFGALGGQTLVQQWGVTSVVGWAPTVAVIGTTGAVLGAGAGAVASSVR